MLEAAGPQLRVVSTMAVGYDNIDLAAATARGIQVAHTPGGPYGGHGRSGLGPHPGDVAPGGGGHALVRSGGFVGWTPTLLLGHEVFGRTLGIVGMGRIGRAVARRTQGFGMRVIYTRAGGPPPTEAIPAGARWEYEERLHDLLRVAQVVSLHVPLTPATHHLIGAAELALLPAGAILINTARGPVVDERAMVAALRTGRLWAAGLDVYEDEPGLASGLAELPNVVLLPHLGSATVETRGAMAELAATNALAVLTGNCAPHLANPEVLACRGHGSSGRPAGRGAVP